MPTRSGLTAALEDAVERAAEADQQVGLMIVGLDGFRAVNDIWGHAAGDEVLKMAAERLRAFANGPVGVARVAGDEFAVILEGDATQSLHKIADDIRKVIGEPFEVEGSSILLGASIGTALFPINAESGQYLFRAADSALSKAKKLGRNTLAVFDTEMQERMEKKAALERDLRLALEREEYVVFYQPQLDLASGRLRGYEALVRWERPGEGILSPRDFLAVAEETGLIREIGDWVLRRACADAASWLDSGVVAVNFSPAQFRAADVDQRIAKVLEETGLAPNRLEIEVPEHMFFSAAGRGRRHPQSHQGARRACRHGRFRRQATPGWRRSRASPSTRSRSTVPSSASLPRTPTWLPSSPLSSRSAARLSVDVTAEGVETQEQVTLLKAAGCSIVQGFLFGAPKRNTDSAQAESASEAPAQAASG